jgi:hypothetical protein
MAGEAGESCGGRIAMIAFLKRFFAIPASIYLLLWFGATALLGLTGIPALNPGTLSLHYYFVPFLVPVAVYYTARLYPHWSLPVCYGSMCGLLWAIPIFIDRGTRYQLASGATTEEGILFRILVFTGCVVVACLLAFGFRRRELQWQEKQAKEYSTADRSK